jgi:hypothetical protein
VSLAATMRRGLAALQVLSERHFRLRYALLTAALFLPLFWAFARTTNLYPVTAWTLMMAGGNLQKYHPYFVLRGETVAGEVVDIPAIELTDALSGRNFGLVMFTVSNGPFRLRSLHPANASILATTGEVEKLPLGTRVPDLLRAWGKIYNSRLSASSTGRLKAIRLDAYEWPGQTYSNYDHFVQSWRLEL